MNKHIILIFIAVVLITGCNSTNGIFGKASSKIEKQQVRIEQVEERIDSIKDKKLNNIGEFAYGMKNIIPNDNSKTNEILSIYTERISSLANKPSLESMLEIKSITSTLLTNNYQLLIQKDKEIAELQKREVKLAEDKDREVQTALDLSKQIALKNDTIQSQLDSYKGWFGIKAILLGLKQLLLTSMWVLIGCTIAFIILRTLAMTNPVCAIIFGIFQSMGASIIHIIEYLIPQSLGTLEDTKKALVKVSDSINSNL